jgi:hypothetical protein
MSRKEGRRVEREVIRALQKIGVMAWKQNDMPAFTVLERTGPGVVKVRMHGAPQPGIADVGGIAPGGRIVQVEVKAGGGSLRPEQRAWLERVRAAGGIVLVAVGKEDIERLGEMAALQGWDAIVGPWSPKRRRKHGVDEGERGGH